MVIEYLRPDAIKQDLPFPLLELKMNYFIVVLSGSYRVSDWILTTRCPSVAIASP